MTTQVPSNMIQDGAVTPVKLSQPLTQGTAVATTSGTTQDITGIPSWAKRITVIFNGVSTNGTSLVQVQVGAGSVQTTGYAANSANIGNATATATASSTTGFVIAGGIASTTRVGHMVLTNVSGNIWVQSHTMNDTNTGFCEHGGGVVTLSGALDRVRITTVNGTDTFDLGSVNILYE